MVLGAQLYTVRDFIQTEQDLDITLGRIAKIGYTTVQFSGVATYDATMVRRVADKHGLKIVLTHVNADRIVNETDKLIEEHNILGCDYIGIGGMPAKYRTDAWFDQFAKDYKEPAKKIAAAGKKLMYHNHHFEFAKINGRNMMEQIVEAFTPEELGITMDTYWVQEAGADVVQWIETLGSRLDCVHLKDMDVLQLPGEIKTVMAPVLEGNMNFKGILEALKKAGSTKYILVEQDTCLENPFVCLEKSYKNLAALGYK